jgi:RimJ/RimL family protein N-acetyltransferase
VHSRRIVLPAEPLRDRPTVLRPWRDADIPSLVAACQDPEIARWTLAPETYGESDARAYMLQRLDATHAGVAAPFAIVAAHDDRVLLGSVSLLRLDWTHLRGEVGYWLAREARGQGHATRAVSLVCAWGARELGLERIVLLAAAGNAPSQRVAERCGFAQEAVLRSYMRGREARHDMVCFGWPVRG